jgi:hypothetical protein
MYKLDDKQLQTLVDITSTRAILAKEQQELQEEQVVLKLKGDAISQQFSQLLEGCKEVEDEKE